MIVNRTIEYVNYRSTQTGEPTKKPVFLRNLSGTAKGHDTVEISDDARKRFLDNSSSTLETAILKALPSVEQFREHLREIERESDMRRRERMDMLKSRINGKQYDMDSLELAQSADAMISDFEGK